MKEKKIILTIAGSDPAGGAGIQTDIRTASDLGLYPCIVVTAITAQNTSEVAGVWGVNDNQLESQIDSLLSDIHPDAVKIGLVASAAALDIIAGKIEEFDLNNVVVDPILSPTLASAQPDQELARKYVERLFPLASLVTPNIPEKDYFESLTGKPFEELCEAFLLKGGHGEGETCFDSLSYHALDKLSSEFQSTSFPTLNNKTQPFMPQDLSPMAEEEYARTLVTREYRHKRIQTSNTHGSGCVLSTAIACFLAKEFHLEKAVETGLKFTYNTLRASADVKFGKGNYGPSLY